MRSGVSARGSLSQVKKWSKQELHAFWRKWYFPANATLYIVGDLTDAGVKEAIDHIHTHFGQVAPKVDGDGKLVQRGPVRPPVEHGWGIGPIRSGAHPGAAGARCRFAALLAQLRACRLFAGLPLLLRRR
jgi:predicted Zn-dependent peptidase